MRLDERTVIVFVHKAHESIMRWQQPHVGRLLSPRQFSRVRDTALSGMPWAADNDCFQGLDDLAYRKMLDAIAPWRGCRFVVAPDVVGDWQQTLVSFDDWIGYLHQVCSQPVAYVLQDGQPASEMPWADIAAVFVGGSTEFKCSDHAHDLVLEAKRRGLWTHMGRVNTAQRMVTAKSWGCDSIDGTSVSMFTDRRLPERIAQARQEQQLNIRESA